MTHHRKLAVGLAAVLLAGGIARAANSPQVPLAAGQIPQFAQPLPQLKLSAPGPGIFAALGNGSMALKMCEFQSAILPPGTPVTPVPAVGKPPLTYTWGYLVDPNPAGTTPCQDLVNIYKDPVSGAIDSYLGPVLVNQRGAPTEIRFVNELGSAATTNVLAYRYSTDLTLHWADPTQVGGMPNHCAHAGIPSFGSACAQNYAGPVAAVPHLHGGEVPPVLDGGPDAWFTSDGAFQGTGYYTRYPGTTPGNQAVYAYPNVQEAAPIWFHDHTLGATRLNVYAGLAGAYFIQDPNQGLPANLQPLTEVVPLVLQDRMFDTNGELFFTAGGAGGVLWALNPDHPYWNPEFVGDTIVVNGKAWPFMNVQAKRYRFLVLNGSNARTYELSLVDQVTKVPGPPIWVIGVDNGYLDAPVKLDPALGQKLIIMPGERYEIIVDFAASPNATILLKNTAKTPFPAGGVPLGNTTARIVQFRVGAPLPAATPDTSYNPASGIALRTGNNAIQRLVDPALGALKAGVVADKTRQLTLNEVMGMGGPAVDPITGLTVTYPGGPLEILVNNTKWSGMSMRTYGDFVGASELPNEGDTEIWEIVNITADAHPIHLHLVAFQLMNRQPIRTSAYLAAYNAAFPGIPNDPMCTPGMYCPGFGPPLHYYTGNPRALGGNPDVTPFLRGALKPPLPHEAGWKDTVVVYPGEVTRLAVRWAPNSLPTTLAKKDLVYPFDPSNGGFVWHCHIIDHEDNEMMRPDYVQLNPDPAALQAGSRLIQIGAAGIYGY